MKPARICAGCGFPSVGFRFVSDKTTVRTCNGCGRMSVFKFESAVDEWRRILRAEREEAKKKSC
jgi:hypothetical protein